MRFRKLPVEIEVETQVEEETEIRTPEGILQASPGDIIVRGVHGELYPVKPLIFAKTYIPADPDDVDAFCFYDSLTPEGVQVITEDKDGVVNITGVHVREQDLRKEEWEHATEFVREFSRALGISDPPENRDDTDEDGREYA